MSTESPALPPQEFWRHLDALQRRVELLEKRISPSLNLESSAELGELTPTVIRITRELFPGDVRICHVNDPDYPGDSYTVVEVQATGSPEEMEDRRSAWHQRVLQLPDRCRHLCLSLAYES